MQKFQKKHGIIPVVLLIAILLAFRSGAFSSAKQPPRTENTGVSIKIAEVKYEDTIPQLILTGSIEGQTSATVSAKLAGRIEQVLVEEGQYVHVGDALIKLESVESENAVRMGQDNLTKAQVNYDFAMTDQRRYQVLYSEGAISQQQLDMSNTKVKIAEADLSSASTNLRNAQQQYAYGVIAAPVDGVVANVAATVGQVVLPGAALLLVQDISQVYAVVNIEQKDIGLVKLGQTAQVTVDAYADKVFEGIVSVMNPEAGTANRMFRTKIKLDNAAEELKAGMFTKVQVATGEAQQVLTVPQAAVIQKQGLYYVFIVEDGKTVRRQVTIGTVTGQGIQIKTGLEPGNQVAVSNVSQLKDGEVVRTVE